MELCLFIEWKVRGAVVSAKPALPWALILHVLGSSSQKFELACLIDEWESFFQEVHLQTMEVWVPSNRRERSPFEACTMQSML